LLPVKGASRFRIYQRVEEFQTLFCHDFALSRVASLRGCPKTKI
jgi:hypothetical protein